MTALFSLRSIRLTILLTFALALLNGCDSTFVQDVQNLAPLREGLVATYQIEEVNLVVQNGHALSIAFINSPFNDLPDADKEPKAREIARFAAAHYASIDHIDEISVAFVIDKQFAMVRYTNNFDSFFFKKSDLMVEEQSTTTSDPPTKP